MYKDQYPELYDIAREMGEDTIEQDMVTDDILEMLGYV